MGVTDFDTKVAVMVRDDLATWQRLNVTAFLMSGIVAEAGTSAIGEPYCDADAREYLPLLVQPVLVLIADEDKLRALASAPNAARCESRIYTADMFTTGNDADNRAAVAATATSDLELVGLALRAPHRDADAVLRRVKRHP